MKIEEGLLNGEVLFHEIIEKTEEEKLLIKKKREEKRFVLKFLETLVPVETVLCSVKLGKMSQYHPSNTVV
jgi:hypothetical protein